MHPATPMCNERMAGYYRETGNYAQAIAALQSIRNPKPDVIAELAYTFQLDGKLGDSARLYARAANAQPKDMTLQLSAAQAEIAAGSRAGANSFLARASALDANYYRVHAIAGEIAELENRDRDALREYAAALANLPEHPAEGPLYGIQLHMNLLALDRSLEDETDARRQLEAAQKEIRAVDSSGPGREQFLRLRSLIKLNSGDPQGALDDINDALTINHDRDDLQLDGDILMKLGQTERSHRGV